MPQKKQGLAVNSNDDSFTKAEQPWFPKSWDTVWNINEIKSYALQIFFHSEKIETINHCPLFHLIQNVMAITLFTQVGTGATKDLQSCELLQKLLFGAFHRWAASLVTGGSIMTQYERAFLKGLSPSQAMMGGAQLAKAMWDRPKPLHPTLGIFNEISTITHITCSLHYIFIFLVMCDWK